MQTTTSISSCDEDLSSLLRRSLSITKLTPSTKHRPMTRQYANDIELVERFTKLTLKPTTKRRIRKRKVSEEDVLIGMMSKVVITPISNRPIESTKRRNFQCNVCKKGGFVSRYHLRLHKSSHHEVGYQHECDICFRRFKTKAGMIGHRSRFCKNNKINKSG